MRAGLFVSSFSLLLTLGFTFHTYASQPTLDCKTKADEDFDKSECRVKYYNQTFRQQCLSLDEYVVDGDYKVECNWNYHHYNSSAFKYRYRKKIVLKKNKDVRIGGFNILHPVNGKTRFKDMELVAEIIDRDFDVLAGIELIPVPKEEFKHNNKIDGYINEQRKLLKDSSLTSSEKEEINENIQKAINSYLKPGYFRILEHLRERDPSWSLIISSRAESAKPSDQKEFTGFYYRAEKVRPMKNKFCAAERIKYNKGVEYGCTPWFNKDINKAFSRRPFIASFESGNFEFTVIAAHIVFSSPKNEKLMANILRPSFGVSKYEGSFPRGSGVTKGNYARWAEVKLTLDLMTKMKNRYQVKNLIYVADFNIEKKMKYWEEVLKSYPGAQVYVDAKTSIDQNKGYSSNYDHFIFNPAEVTNCEKNGKVDADRIDFFETKYIWDYVEDNYYIGNGDWIMDRFMSRFKDKVEAHGRVGSLKIRPFRVDEEKIKTRLEQQLLDPSKTNFNLGIKVISDHVPVKMTCSNR